MPSPLLLRMPLRCWVFVTTTVLCFAWFCSKYSRHLTLSLSLIQKPDDCLITVLYLAWYICFFPCHFVIDFHVNVDFLCFLSFAPLCMPTLNHVIITCVFVIHTYSLYFTIIPIFFPCIFFVFALLCFLSAAQIFSEYGWRTTNTSVSKAVFNRCFLSVLTSLFFHRVAITDGIISVVVPFVCMYVYIKWAWLHKKAIHNIERLICDFRLNRVQILRSNMMIIVGARKDSVRRVRMSVRASKRDRERGIVSMWRKMISSKALYVNGLSLNTSIFSCVFFFFFVTFKSNRLA